MTSAQGAPGTSQANLRRQIAMRPAELEAFTHERLTATMCTLNGDGTIHAVAMWYGFLDGALAFETNTKSQKAQNLRRNENLTVSIEDGEVYEELRGCTLIGRGEIIEEPERVFDLCRDVYERYTRPYTESDRAFVEGMMRKRVVVKLHVDSTATWDHRKLRG